MNGAYMMKMNPYQGDSPKVVFICSGGILRSPTAAHYMAEHWGWNTRSAGIYPEAIPQVTSNLMEWADRVYVMEDHHKEFILSKWDVVDKLKVLGIRDNYRYMQYELKQLLQDYFEEEDWNDDASR